jgi:hypothetical protein
MVYASTGNPGHWSPGLRCAYTGDDHTHEKCNDGTYDNKWSMTIFGRKVENGEVVFAYQMTPFDQWDLTASTRTSLWTSKSTESRARCWCISTVTASTENQTAAWKARLRFFVTGRNGNLIAKPAIAISPVPTSTAFFCASNANSSPTLPENELLKTKRKT